MKQYVAHYEGGKYEFPARNYVSATQTAILIAQNKGCTVRLQGVGNILGGGLFYPWMQAPPNQGWTTA